MENGADCMAQGGLCETGETRVFRTLYGETTINGFRNIGSSGPKITALKVSSTV